MSAISLLQAVEANDLEAVGQSLQTGLIALEGVDDKGRSALHLAAAHGRLEIVRQLIAAGADLDQTDHQHEATPLHWAAMHGHGNVVHALLKAGADPNLCDKHGKTPLQYALDGFSGSLTPWEKCTSPTRFYGSISMVLLHGADVG